MATTTDIRCVLAALAICLLAFAGCGEAKPVELGPGAVETGDPAATFAPVVLFDRSERWPPVSADWFLDRSALWFAEDDGCPDRKVAVGRELAHQRNPEIDWTFKPGLGSGNPRYPRYTYDAGCELQLATKVYAADRTRPFDRERPRGLHSGEGFYLDLMDWARAEAPPLDAMPAYVDRRARGTTVTLAYWTLHAMNAPPGRRGALHEGDWERVDVILRRGEPGDRRYEPRAVRLTSPTGIAVVPWQRLRLANGTHPVLKSALGSHIVTPATSRGRCAGCVRWHTGRRLERLRSRPWYGFGGAWGDLGPTDATTGPLGPGAG
jgi:hypothetical protein